MSINNLNGGVLIRRRMMMQRKEKEPEPMPSGRELWYITTNDSVSPTYSSIYLLTNTYNSEEKGKLTWKSVNTVRDWLRQSSTLKQIKLPSGITSISSAAFYYCTSLSIIYMGATTPPTITTGTLGTFANCPISVIFVPAASVETYKSASGWSSYASKIRAFTIK